MHCAVDRAEVAEKTKCCGFPNGEWRSNRGANGIRGIFVYLQLKKYYNDKRGFISDKSILKTKCFEGKCFMRLFIATLAACAVLTGYPAFADEAAEQEAVRIEIDQQAKAFVFIIDDEPVAMLDKKGFHVPGEITYGRWMTDTGPEAINAKIKNRGEGQGDE
jgi:hypothetical protein